MTGQFTTKLPLSIGHAGDLKLKSGTTVLLPDRAATASCSVMGAAPGSRETDLLAPEDTVQSVDAIVLSGGSAFGLAAADGVQCRLAEYGRGFRVGSAVIPIVSAAICFDLQNGGDKSGIPAEGRKTGLPSPYWKLGYDAVSGAGATTPLGTAGAGTGAKTADLKGGFGAARGETENGLILEAYAVCNAVGSTIAAQNGAFHARPFEMNGEFGDRNPDILRPPFPLASKLHATARGNTTIGCIATNAKLDKARLKRLAMSAHTGLARAIWPSHTPLDGDLVFALSAGGEDVADDLAFTELCAIAASTFSRAIALGVYHAEAAEGDLLPVWRAEYG